MTLNLSQLRTQISQVFDAGLAAGDVEFTPSEVTTNAEGSVEFEIRYAPALAHKPVPASKPKDELAKDPFLPPYGPHSFIQDINDEEDGERLVVLLNKFCVTPRHFLLCTKEFASQLLPPTPTELHTSFRILQAYAKPSAGQPAEPHCAFFNCGNASGASQPHKHLQFVALYSGVLPFEEEIEASRPTTLRPGQTWDLPHSVMPPFHAIADTSKAARMSAPEAKRYLGGNLLALLDRSFDNLRHLADQQSEVPRKRGQMSYNLVITTNFMLIAPRSESEYKFEDGSALSMNALAFAGMVMTKKQEQLDLVKQVGVKKMLQAVGYPRAEMGPGGVGEDQVDVD